MYDRLADVPVWRLRFDQYPGLTVRVTVPTVEARAVATRIIPWLASGDAVRVTRAVAELAVPFADSLLSWDLVWGGRRVKPTRRGVVRVDMDVLLAVLREWVALWPAHNETPAEDDGAELDRELAGLPMTALDPDGDAVAELVGVAGG